MPFAPEDTEQLQPQKAVRFRDVRGSDRTHGPIMTQGAGRAWVGEEAGKLSWTPTP